jgi:hypothetical protein
MVLLLIQDLTEESLCPLERGDAKVELFSVENSHVLLSVFASRSGKGTRRHSKVEPFPAMPSLHWAMVLYLLWRHYLLVYQDRWSYFLLEVGYRWKDFMSWTVRHCGDISCRVS